MGLQKKDTGQNFPPKIKDGKISTADIKVFEDNKDPITNCFLGGIGGMTTGNGSTTGGTLWNGKKKMKRNIVLICKVTTAYIYIQDTNTLIVSSTMGNATFES